MALGSASRSVRRRGTKAKYRKGSATWCALHGIPSHGQGKSRERIATKKKAK